MARKTAAEDSNMATNERPEIEITPEMIEAGVAELRLTDSHDALTGTVKGVYRAMEAARRASGDTRQPVDEPSP